MCQCKLRALFVLHLFALLVLVTFSRYSGVVLNRNSP